MANGIKTMNEWRDYIHDWACRKGWWTNPNIDVVTRQRIGCMEESDDILRDKTWRNLGELLALLHSEVSEALEDYRNGNMETRLVEDEHGQKKPCGFNSEMADVFIRALDICGAYGIDIDDEIALKMAFNEKRPYRHGGKKA